LNDQFPTLKSRRNENHVIQVLELQDFFNGIDDCASTSNANDAGWSGEMVVDSGMCG
jgi:hypothetical protein